MDMQRIEATQMLSLNYILRKRNKIISAECSLPWPPLRLRDLEVRISSPSGSERSPAAKRFGAC